MEKTDSWETRRQKLTAILLEEEELFDLRFLMKEMEYRSKRVLIHDIMSVAKTFKSQGIKLKINPPSCKACGYSFKQKQFELKIPSKCPSCKEERIEWPTVRLIKRS